MSDLITRIKARAALGMAEAASPDCAPPWERIAIGLFGLAMVLLGMLIKSVGAA